MKSISKKLKNENGAVEIVEAAFVFPVVIFVVILMIYLGNFYYQQSKMDAITVRGAEYLAAVYTNPILAQGELPTDSTGINVKPYRYLFGDSEAEAKAKDFINGLIKNTGTGYFSGMKMNGTIKQCKINNYIVYHTASVQIEYSMNLMPLRFFDLPPLVKCSTATVESAADPSEFIRTVDMIMDYSDQTGLTDKIRQTVGKFTGNK